MKKSNFSSKKIQLILAGIVVFLFILIGAIFFLNRPKLEIEDINLTNLTSGSFTIVWTTEEPTEGILYVSSSQGMEDKTMHYDDRDTEVNEDGDRVLKIEGTGKYTSHHVTVTGLDPETTYYFRLGDKTGRIYDVSGFEQASMYVKTTPVVDSVVSPDPVYGKVVDKDGNPVIDGVVMVQMMSDKSNPISVLNSAYLSANGTYTIDIANIRDLDEVSLLNHKNVEYEKLIVITNKDYENDMVLTTPDLDQPVPQLQLGEEIVKELNERDSNLVNNVNARIVDGGDPTNTPAPPEDPTNTPAPPEDPTNTPAPPEDPTNTPAPPEDPTNTPAPTEPNPQLCRYAPEFCPEESDGTDDDVTSTPTPTVGEPEQDLCSSGSGNYCKDGNLWNCSASGELTQIEVCSCGCHVSAPGTNDYCESCEEETPPATTPTSTPVQAEDLCPGLRGAALVQCLQEYGVEVPDYAEADGGQRHCSGDNLYTVDNFGIVTGATTCDLGCATIAGTSDRCCYVHETDNGCENPEPPVVEPSDGEPEQENNLGVITQETGEDVLRWTISNDVSSTYLEVNTNGLLPSEGGAGGLCGANIHVRQGQIAGEQGFDFQVPTAFATLPGYEIQCEQIEDFVRTEFDRRGFTTDADWLPDLSMAFDPEENIELLLNEMEDREYYDWARGAINAADGFDGTRQRASDLVNWWSTVSNQPDLTWESVVEAANSEDGIREGAEQTLEWAVGLFNNGLIPETNVSVTAEDGTALIQSEAVSVREGSTGCYSDYDGEEYDIGEKACYNSTTLITCYEDIFGGGFHWGPGMLCHTNRTEVNNGGTPNKICLDGACIDNPEYGASDDDGSYYIPNYLEKSLSSKVSAQENTDTEVTEIGGSTYITPGEYEISGSNIANKKMTITNPSKVMYYYDQNGNGQKDEGEPLVLDLADMLDISFNKVAEIQTYNVKVGWNTFSFPMLMTGENTSGVSTASDLLMKMRDEGINATHVTTYRSGQFLIYSERENENGELMTYGEDFSILPGEGYFVRSYTNKRFVLKGRKVEGSLEFLVENGWNLVNIYNENKMNYGGFEVLRQMNSKGIQASTLSMWSSGMYRNVVLHESTEYGNDFKVFPYSSYWVRVDSEGMKKFKPE